MLYGQNGKLMFSLKNKQLIQSCVVWLTHLSCFRYWIYWSEFLISLKKIFLTEKESKPLLVSVHVSASICIVVKKKDTKRRLYPESALVCLAEMTVLPLRQGHDSQKTDIMKSMVILPLLYPCCTWCFSLLLTCHTTTHCKIQYVGDKQLEGN